MSKLIKFYTLNIMHITQSSYLKIMGWINSSVSFLVQLDCTSHLSGATNVSANGDEVHSWSQTCCVCYLMPVFLYFFFFGCSISHSLQDPKFPNQGLNLDPGSESLESYLLATRESLSISISTPVCFFHSCGQEVHPISKLKPPPMSSILHTLFFLLLK